MESDNLRKLKNLLLQSSRTLFFPIHIVLLCIVRVLLAIPLVCIVVVPVLFACFLISFLVPWGVAFLEGLTSHHRYEAFINTMAFIGSLGLLSYLVNRSFDTIMRSAVSLGKSLVKIMCLQWIPGFEIRKGLTTTGEQINQAWMRIVDTYKSSGLLVLSTTLITVIGVLIYHLETGKRVSVNLEAELENIVQLQQHLNQEFNQSLTTVKAKLELMVIHHNELTEKFDGLFKDYNRSIVVYSLVYPPQGDLDSKKGICPDNEEFHTLEWLTKFKSAITQCAENGSRVKIDVTGFSSIAPVATANGYGSSGLLNCEIANQRAEAVMGFLIEDGYQCKAFLEDSLWELPENKLCTRKMDEISFGGDRGLAYDVTYRPWQNYEQMKRARPVNDGTLVGVRRYASEFLNRVVQITVENDACWRGEWKQRLYN